MSYANLVRADNIPQTEPLNNRQASNNAGGFVYALDIWARLNRFLILGSDAQSYYQSARQLTRDNLKVVDECWNADYSRTAQVITDVSVAGRAAKNSPALFAMAIGTLNDNVDARRAALACVDAVCRTASHLFEFSNILDAVGRGWGRAVQRSVSGWYEKRTPDQLGYQMTKYRSRNDYSHKRLIQRTRPSAADQNDQRVALYRWACGRDLDGLALPDVVVGHLAAMKCDTAQELVPLIEKYKLTWEAVPNWALKDKQVWEALLPNLGLTALLRNLGTLSGVGVTAPLSKATNDVVERLTNQEALHKARLHPYAVLTALSVYRRGHSVLGSRSWTPNSVIIDALDNAFYKTFSNVEPTGKRHLLAIDVSGSMATNLIGGQVPARSAAAAMAMVTARTEQQHHFVGFAGGITPLNISASMDLGSVVKGIHNNKFSRTDCAAPMIYAMENDLEVDAFVVYTDNETYSGQVHPSVALKQYRKASGINAKLIVAAMTSTGFSIADPLDAGMLDIVGFDTAAVNIMGDFVKA